MPNKLPAKQVSILAHRKRRLVEDASHKTVKRLNRGFKLSHKAATFLKAEVFVNKFRKAERDEKRMKRTILSQQLFRPPSNEEKQKLLIAFRHRAHRIASPATVKILKSMRLGQLHNAVFLRNDTESAALLKLVEPYVTWGYPDINTVRNVVFKHGFFKVDNKRTALTSNKLIEEQLGECGIICIEDIIHEIYTATDNFNAIKKVMVPFQLKAPKDGWKRKTGLSFKRGGEYGHRHFEINELIEKCL